LTCSACYYRRVVMYVPVVSSVERPLVGDKGWGAKEKKYSLKPLGVAALSYTPWLVRPQHKVYFFLCRFWTLKAFLQVLGRVPGTLTPGRYTRGILLTSYLRGEEWPPFCAKHISHSMEQTSVEGKEASQQWSCESTATSQRRRLGCLTTTYLPYLYQPECGHVFTTRPQ
jgi:hypothetical protein